jgi:hypothetical protein
MVVVEEVVNPIGDVVVQSSEVHSVTIDKDAGPTAEEAIEMLEVILSDTGLDKSVSS